jgi:hypothetical protein
MRKARTTSDPGYENRLLRRELFLSTQFLYCGQYGVITTTWAPARCTAAIILNTIVYFRKIMFGEV